MSYAHHVESDFAASQVARMFEADPSLCFASKQTPPNFSASAAYEPSGSRWPLADGVVSLRLIGGGGQRDVALEYKRENEGVHGLLTGIGQTLAYLHKGYSGAVLVVPRSYASLPNSASRVREILEENRVGAAIGVFDYSLPDNSSATPFEGRMKCVRPMTIGSRPSTGISSQRRRTQWVHVREGSTTRDAYFRFLQLAKMLSVSDRPSRYAIPEPLKQAVDTMAPGQDPAAYLSSAADDRFLSKVWREFWFCFVATKEVLTPWRKKGSMYVVPNARTRIEKDNQAGYSQLFEGRANGLKNVIVDDLNAGRITETEGWKRFAVGFSVPGKQSKQGVQQRSHSYREDIDSSLEQLKWIGPDGYPTDTGYRFADLCERYGGASSEAAIEYLGATMIQVGHYGSFLHYVHRLSDAIFAADPLAFTCEDNRASPVFDEDSYRAYLAELEREMTDNLKVMNKVSRRSTTRPRTPFQAELTFLRNYGFVSRSRHRLGVGIPINWAKVHEAMGIDL